MRSPPTKSAHFEKARKYREYPCFRGSHRGPAWWNPSDSSPRWPGNDPALRQAAEPPGNGLQEHETIEAPGTPWVVRNWHEARQFRSPGGRSLPSHSYPSHRSSKPRLSSCRNSDSSVLSRAGQEERFYGVSAEKSKGQTPRTCGPHMYL